MKIVNETRDKHFYFEGWGWLVASSGTGMLSKSPNGGLNTTKIAAGSRESLIKAWGTPRGIEMRPPVFKTIVSEPIRNRP